MKKVAAVLLIVSVVFSLNGCHAAQAGIEAETSQATTGATAPEPTQTATTLTATESLPPKTVPPETAPIFIPEWTEEERQRLWTPLCESFIYLRDLDMTTILCQVPLGAELLLHKWQGKFALVTYNGRQGYVTANYIKPLDTEYFTKRLTVLSPTAQYTYDQMVADMAALQAAYPDSVTVSGIGESELGRNIPVMLVGNPQAPNHVLLQGVMHAREHFTAWLLMAIIDHSLSAKLLSDNVCYHVIPMSNPDGVCISQSQTLNDSQTEIYQRDIACGYTGYDSKTYAQKWKANALGVDLNRNFPSGWENSLERPLPSSERFRGDSPLCAAESKALANYTQSRHFSATFSFHSHGSVLYYAYGSKQPVNDLSYSLALAVQQPTGYRPIGGYDGTSGAGYKDWAIDALEIPSITVEIGSNSTPLENRDLYNTFARFENFIPAINQWLIDTF
ncbi:MAG: hypothetical protein IJZ14_02265 [Oscillospiraceae bacterium]|nr:hypothetical protein [Oscillospiraceae bacterium]